MLRRVMGVGLVLLAVALPWASARAGLRVTDENLGATFAVPDGYDAAPAAPPVVAAGQAAPLIFTRGQMNTDSFEVLQVVPLRGTIGREKMDRKIVEDSARAAIQGSGASMTGFDYRTARWNGFELEMVVGRVSKQGRKLVTFSTQVPLVRHALQLSLMGPAREEARLDSQFQATLAS